MTATERQDREAEAAYQEWKAAHQRQAFVAWWRAVLVYVGWFSLGAAVAAYLTWMAS